MRKLFGISAVIALLSGIAAQAATIQENAGFPDVDIIDSQLVDESTAGIRDIVNPIEAHMGQSFTLTNLTTLRAITVKSHNTVTWNTGDDVLELWIGADADTNAANFVAGATNLLTTVDMGGVTATAGNYYTINLDADLVLPAGEYGYQFRWTSTVGSHQWFLRRANTGGDYEGGGLLFVQKTDGSAIDFPFDVTAGFANDMVFGMHSAVVGTVPTFTVDPEEISMLLVPPNDQTTESVEVAFTSDTTMDIAVSITDESHAGSFTVLSTTPQTITTNTTLEFEFDNSVANLGIGESATGLVVIAWNETGSTVTKEVVIPIGVVNGVAAEDSTFNALVSENWGNPSNWDTGRVPGALAADPAYVQSGLTATVATNVTGLFSWGTTVRGGATLNIDADLLGMTYIRLGYDASEYGIVNQSAGDVDASTQLLIGEATGSAASNSVYTLSGGTLDLLGNSTFSVNVGSVFDVNGGAFSMDQGPANINLNGTGLIKVQSGSFKSVGTAADDVLTVYTDVEISGGTVDLNGQNKFTSQLKVIGDSATINIDRLNTPPGGNIGELVFEMGATGISSINGIGFGTLSGYNLTVDGANYVGGSGTYTLYDCQNLTAVPASYTISNFVEGVTAVVTNDASTHSIVLNITVPGYDGWIGGYHLFGTNAAWDVDYDLDGEINYYEYAFGGDPTNAAVLGFACTGYVVDDGGTDYYEYIYPRRIGSETETELLYEAQFNENLTLPGSALGVVELAPTGLFNAEYESVTNRVDITGKPAGFMQVIAEQL